MIKRRVETLEKKAPDGKIDIPIKAWGMNQDRTEIERLTGIKFTWKGENDIHADCTISQRTVFS